MQIILLISIVAATMIWFGIESITNIRRENQGRPWTWTSIISVIVVIVCSSLNPLITMISVILSATMLWMIFSIVCKQRCLEFRSFLNGE